MDVSMLYTVRRFLEANMSVGSGDVVMDCLLMVVIAVVAVATYYITKKLFKFDFEKIL